MNGWIRFIMAALVIAMATSVSTPAPASDDTDVVATAPLAYVSDYLSFIGADGLGHVAFALDTNRGRDGDSYQAEHFAVLYDERRGWLDVAGNGPYANADKEVIRIPDSPGFHFAGTPQSGLTVVSEPNRLTLRIDPIPERMRRTHDDAVVRMGSASAVLDWQGRTIHGRVIYEYLAMPNFNRLTHTYIGLWKEFQGLYLAVDRTKDLYLHRQHSDRLAALVGGVAGFFVLDDETEVMDDPDVQILDRDFTLGLYRWPTAWRVTWRGARGPASLTAVLTNRKAIKNWMIGGFSMGIVKGELLYDGHRWPVYGLAELLM